MEFENLTQTQETLLDEINTTKTYIGKSDCTSGNAYRVTMTRNGVKRATKTTLSSRFCVIVRLMNTQEILPIL